MSQFLLTVDDLTFDLPWSKPDIFRLQLLYKKWALEIKSCGLTPFLFGEFWSSGQPNARTIQIWFEFDRDFTVVSEPIVTKTKYVLAKLFSDSINEFRLFLEIAIVERGGVSRIFDICQLLEAERNDGSGFSDHELPLVLDVFKRYELVNRGQPEFCEENKEALGFFEGEFFIRNEGFLRRLFDNAKNGRVFLTPVPLFELFN